MNYQMHGKKVIITGANSGIGKAAAIQLAQMGATVVLACRSFDRGSKALLEIRTQSGSQDVELLVVDMSSLESIRDFVKEYKKRFNKLDVLIHNAANFDHSIRKPIITTEGIETIFATNHIGIFYMTNLFMELLKASSPSRIITVASKGLLVYPNLDIEFDNLYGERKFSVQHAYYHSKLAQIMFTYDLAKRLNGTGVTVNCVQVGNVAIPDERLESLPGILKKLYSIKRSKAMSPEKMAETYVFLACDPVVKDITGGYWNEQNQQISSNKNSYNQQTWKKLWAVSETMCGLGSGDELYREKAE